MRSMLLWSWLMFCMLALTASSGQAQDCPDPEDSNPCCQMGKNSIVFDKDMPVSNGAKKLKASGICLKKALGWKCETVTVEILDANQMDKVIDTFNRPASPAWDFQLENFPAGTYKVRVKGTFKNGAQTEDKDVTSGKIIVQ